MKIPTIIVRTLLGLLFIFASVMVLFNLAPQPELHGNMKIFMEGVNATGYLLTLIKVTELVCGIAFLTGHFVPLAAIVISPVIINIFLIHLFLEPSEMVLPVLLVLANCFLGYAYREKFKLILSAT